MNLFLIMTSKKLEGKRKSSFKNATLRSLFSYFGESAKGKERSIPQDLAEGLTYIQMRLPVEKITLEFEEELKKKIEGNIYHAKIREAREEDLEIIKDIYNKSWLTSNTPFRPIEKRTLQIIFEDPKTIFLIARVYGIDGGFIIIDLEGKEEEYGVIAGLGVLPRFQRKGLGTVLGMAAWAHLKQKGVKELRCEVYKGNKVSYEFIKGLKFESFGEKVYRKEDFELEEP
jgi:ribosomal protein S18 acetylase RimI-like enzyme